MRFRRQVAFERFLARLVAEPSPRWLLKGGYALELRLGHRARSTKDLDIGVPSPPLELSGSPFRTALLRDMLADAADRNLGDWFEYSVGEAMLDLDAPPEGGARFPVRCLLDGRLFTQFHVDVALGGPLLGVPEQVETRDLLAFAGIPRTQIPVMLTEQHFAEKVHAYTYPWGDRTNTRVRDLVDMVLLIDAGTLRPAVVAEALRLTFAVRGSRAIPPKLPPPPVEWAAPFRAMAEEVGLAERTAEQAYARVAAYYETCRSEWRDHHRSLGSVRGCPSHYSCPAPRPAIQPPVR
jgi:hypothetical protein